MKPARLTDWEEIRRRFDAIRADIERGAGLSPEEERHLLRTRAQELAREPKTSAPAGETLEVVEFRPGERHYAFPFTPP